METAVLDLLPVVGQTLAIYVFLVVCVIVLGRRPVTQITFVQLVVVMLIGSAVETSMVAGNTTLPAGLVAATTLLLANRLFSLLLARWTPLRRWVLGGPTVLVHNGEILNDSLHRVGLTVADVESAIRERGFDDIKDVRYAILEVDGSIGVIPTDVPIHRLSRSVLPKS
jgi:uncharacterized membrane protein YcaP (DUF421 family)